MKRALAVAAAGVVLVTASVTAAQSFDGRYCRNGGFPGEDSEGFRAATVKGEAGTRAYFHDDAPGCPQNSSCRFDDYVVPGEHVLTSFVREGWVCAFQPEKYYAGWVEAKSLDIRPPDPPAPLSDWIGTWGGGQVRIKITAGAQPGTLDADGITFWHGLGNNDRFGNFMGTGRPQGNVLYMEDPPGDSDGCQVWMTLVAGYMTTRDNSSCGATNARFNEVFSKSTVKE